MEKRTRALPPSAQRFTPRRRHAVPRPGCEGPQRPGYGGPMAVQVSEREARQVAEAARETEWKLPSFGRELFLGNFRLDLIHPQPRQDDRAVEKGERFLA